MRKRSDRGQAHKLTPWAQSHEALEQHYKLMTDFKNRVSIEQVEESNELAPKFDEQGLISCVTTAAESGEVLMLGYMNAEALRLTIETGEAHYFSRSRQVLWHKGATSGLVQKIVEMRIDDDQDAVWIAVSIAGAGKTEGLDASCHVGYRSCFYREVETGKNRSNELIFKEDEKTFDPEEIYPGAENPTKL